jgi:hypothetical protein
VIARFVVDECEPWMFAEDPCERIARLGLKLVENRAGHSHDFGEPG